MLDLRLIREEPQKLRKAIHDKQMPASLKSLEELLVVDEEYRLLRQDLEAKQAERNSSSKKIGELKRKGESADELMQQMSKLSDEVKKLEDKDRILAEKLHQLMLDIPNPAHESVPYGESEHDNVVFKEWGKKPEFNFSAKSHWDIAVAKGWLDFESGVKTTGAGFPIFRGDGARLLRSLIQFCLNYLVDKGYMEHAVPLMVNSDSATATGQLPDKEGQMYEVSDGFYLIPTSELILAGIHRDEILDSAQLPLKYTAHSACFRREAGSYGAHVRAQPSPSI
ncbi:MAG: aminoacyl--tRNA ligase-related protein [Deinococcales bacterium]